MLYCDYVVYGGIALLNIDKVKNLKNLPHNTLIALKMLKDDRISSTQKFIFIGLSSLYFIWPWDFIFDIPFVGQIDDIAVFFALFSWFMSKVPKDIRNEYGWKDMK